MNDTKPDDKPPTDPAVPPASEPTPPAPAPAEPAIVENPPPKSLESPSTDSAVPEPQPAVPAPAAAPKPDDSEPPWLPPPESRWKRNADAFKELPPTRSWRTDGSFVVLLIFLVPFAIFIFFLVVCAIQGNRIG